jgi:hypothetical protein
MLCPMNIGSRGSRVACHYQTAYDGRDKSEASYMATFKRFKLFIYNPIRMSGPIYCLYTERFVFGASE